MWNVFKLIDIKQNRTYYFFDDVVNIKNLDSKKVKIDEKSCQHVLIYYTGYVTIKNLNYVEINSVNPLHVITDKTNSTLKKRIKIYI